MSEGEIREWIEACFAMRFFLGELQNRSECYTHSIDLEVDILLFDELNLELARESKRGYPYDLSDLTQRITNRKALLQMNQTSRRKLWT